MKFFDRFKKTNSEEPKEEVPVVDQPAAKKIIGVYGTRGKTVVTELMSHLLNNSGIGAGFLSSTGTLVNKEFGKSLFAEDVSRKELKELLEYSTSPFFIIELKDSGIDNELYSELQLDGVIVPNTITKESTQKLSHITDLLREGGVLLGNGIDISLRNWFFENRDKIKKPLYLGMVNENDYNIVNKSIDSGIEYVFRENNYLTPNPASYSVINKLLSSTMAEALSGVSNLTRYTQGFKTAKGRFEVISIKDRTIVIDNARSAEDLELVLKEITNLKPMGKKIITVLGLEGDYLDFTLPETAQKYSSLTILTPYAAKKFKNYDINSAVFTHNHSGKRFVAVERVGSQEEYFMLNKENLKQRIQKVVSNSDSPFVTFDADDYTSRLNAIDFAIQYAEAGDIILLAGKGDEDFISYNDVEYTWSEHEAVRLASKE